MTLLGFSTPAAAQQVRSVNPYGTDIEITVALREQQSPLGEISLHISKEGILSLSPASLVSALGNRIISSARDELLRLPIQDGRASLVALAQLGFQLTFNEADLDLAVTLPLRVRPNRDYSVMGPPREEVGDFDPAAGFSIAANLRLSGDLNQSDFGTNFNSAANLGILGRVAGFAYQSNFRLSSSDGQLVRESSRVIFDDVQRALRWQIGDVQPFVSSAVGGEDIFGVGVSRETDALRPDRIAQLRATQSFALQEPSEVVVSVNGRVVSRRNLPVGNYNVADFPFVQGRNQVELVIINPAGEREQLSFDQFLDSRLIQAGSTEFGFALGITSAPGFAGVRTYDASNWALNAHYIKGASEKLTVGMSTSLNAQRSIILATAVYAGEAGATSGRLGITASEDGAAIGTAGFGLVRALGEQRGTISSRSLRLGLDGRFDFSGASSDLINASIGYAWPLTRSINANLDLRVSGNTASSSLQTSFSLTSDIRLDVAIDWRFGGGLVQSDLRQRGFGLSLGLSRSFGATGQGRARYDSRLSEGRVSFASAAPAGLGRWSSSFETAASADNGNLSISGSAFYNRFDIATQANAGWQNGRATQRLSFRTGTALAFAKGQFAIGRPVGDSFAIIAAHKSLDDRVISLRSQGGDTSPTARTGFFGPALVTGLGTYAPRSVTVSVEDPPEGYDIGSGTFRVAPPLFGGYRFIIGSDTPNSVIGSLILSNGRPASLVAGVATSLDWPNVPPMTVFTNADGQFSLTGLGAGRWSLKMRGIDAPFEFVLSASATNFTELGNIRARPLP